MISALIRKYIVNHSEESMQVEETLKAKMSFLICYKQKVRYEICEVFRFSELDF